MALSSPGVEVKVIDESFYTPAEPGTVPLIIVATAENKSNGGGTGTAPGTLAANAGEVYLLTSQRDLADTFGDPIFKTDASGNPVHAGEQNEYGLQAAYSLLGVSNRAYVARADVDLGELDASADEPTSNPAGGTHWLDTQVTKWGIFEWNGAPITTTGGQKFGNKIPLVITDSTKVDAGTGGPRTSVGAIGDYAIVAVDTSATTESLTTAHGDNFELQLWMKSKGNSAAGVTAGDWVKVGSPEWLNSHATIAGQTAPTSINASHSVVINGTTVVAGGITVAALANSINSAGIAGITAAAVNGKLEIYSDGDSDEGDSTTANLVTIAAGTGTLVAATVATSILGIKAGTYYGPKLAIQKHTSVPEWKSGDTYPRPTGSVWMKTTTPNLGASYSVKRWNSTTAVWDTLSCPLYADGQTALAELDSTGGGLNVAVGAIYAQFNHTEDSGVDLTPKLANARLFRRGASGATTITSDKIVTSTFTTSTSYTFTMAESLAGETALDTAKVISFTGGASDQEGETIAAAINAAGFVNITAEVITGPKLVIKHNAGGEIRITEGTNTPVNNIFSAYVYEPSSATFGTGTKYFQAAPAGASEDYVASNWEPLVFAASGDAPNRIPEDGQMWYSSVVDEVDIMIHDGDTWVGYKYSTSPFYANGTDPQGPIVAASMPETQSDATALVTGDLWVDTSDLENYPQIYKYNDAIVATVGFDSRKWILLDKSDQSTEDGVLFADARYNTAGSNGDIAGDIQDLLESPYLDPDAPDPALYPKGMLLWNLRRSGYNVKQYKRNYIDTALDNNRYTVDGAGAFDKTGDAESMAAYAGNRWVTISSNQDDGSGSFGRKAQRKVVVKALQAVVNSNDAMRDEERRVFNLIACPGYPELIGEMISLNYDRGLTAFVVGDTPARLTSDATSLLGWASNEAGANEDNDVGAVSFDEYMGMFYPWGFSSDNFGNNVVVPPSHMILRTIALNDQVAYPWFAPAGVRRGGITNATAVGYITGEGEFQSVALNTGQRDTLYEQKINPITFLTGTGLVNYGQKTRARAASALDRINVARLIVYLRRQLNQLAKPYLFEPNDKITRDQIKAAVESLLVELVGQRALYDYLVVCDESNNTPSRIDRNELWIDIAIEPVKAVEFIYIPLRIKNTGEIASLG